MTSTEKREYELKKKVREQFKTSLKKCYKSKETTMLLIKQNEEFIENFKTKKEEVNELKEKYKNQIEKARIGAEKYENNIRNKGEQYIRTKRTIYLELLSMDKNVEVKNQELEYFDASIEIYKQQIEFQKEILSITEKDIEVILYDLEYNIKYSI